MDNKGIEQRYIAWCISLMINLIALMHLCHSVMDLPQYKQKV